MKTLFKHLVVNLVLFCIIPLNIHCQSRWDGVIKFYNYFDKYSIDITQISSLVEWGNESANISSVELDKTNNMKIRIPSELVKFRGLGEEEKYNISIEGKVDKNGIFTGKAVFPDIHYENGTKMDSREYDIQFKFNEDGTASVYSNNNIILKLKQNPK